MSEPATLAEWIARIEAIESIPMRNQVGVIVYWRLFSDMEATERVPDFDKYLREWSPKGYPADDDLRDELVRLGIHPTTARAWSRTPRTSSDDSIRLKAQRLRERRERNRRKNVKK